MPHLSHAGAGLLNIYDALPKVVALIALHRDQPQRAPDLLHCARAQADQAGVAQQHCVEPEQVARVPACSQGAQRSASRGSQDHACLFQAHAMVYTKYGG